MKRLFAAALLALTSAVFGATLNPIQLLNPAGSTIGQAVVSTGPTTAPAWGNVTATSLAPQPANTVMSNATGSTASPTAFAMPSCSGANNALRWTSGSGFTCASSIALTSGALSQFAATTSAQLAGIVSDETGSGSLVFGTSPTLTTPNIVGTTTNNNANAGSVGEYQTVTGGSSGISNATNTNMTSISLTAGDWDAQCSVSYTPAAGTTVTGYTATVSTTSAAGSSLGATQVISGTSLTSSFGIGIAVSPVVRFSLASTTTVFCTGLGAFSGGTLSAQGLIRARRVH